MKTLAYKHIIILLAITFLASDLYAKNRRQVEKKRVIEKSYDVSANHTLEIQNKYGRVHVNTWDQNKIDIKIEMVAHGKNEERAQQLLDKLDINIDDSGNLIRFETNLKGVVNNRRSQSFEINYEVNMPSKNALNLKNSFGETYLADFEGRLDLNVSYGDIKAEKLLGDSKIRIAFSGGEIDEVKSGELTVKYSNVDFETMGNVELDQGYSDIRVDNIGDLIIDLKYGKLEVETLNSAQGSVGFSDFEIEYLRSALDLKTSYAGGFRVDKVSKNFQSIDLEGKFGGFKLGFEKGVNATFETYLKFANFNYSDMNVDLTYKEKADTKSEYKGKIGDGGGGKISIRSSYGDIRFYND